MAGLVHEIQQNKRKSVWLIVAFVLFVAAVGIAFNFYLEGGWIGIAIALTITLVSTVTSYWSSDRVALAMSRAEAADPTEFARLHNIVEGLAIAAGIPKPRVYVVDDAAPNAFATGRNPENAAIAVTTGLLEKLSRVELEGVIAHEMAHIKDYDILVSTIAVTMVGLIALLADWGVRVFWFKGSDNRSNNGPLGAILALVAIVLIILSPLIARLMQAAVSRRRESLADVEAVNLTRYPPGLISALEKLRDDRTVVSTASRATAHLWIESPLARSPEEGKLSRLNNLYDTHPPLDERIEVLRSL